MAIQGADGGLGPAARVAVGCRGPQKISNRKHVGVSFCRGSRIGVRWDAQNRVPPRKDTHNYIELNCWNI